MKVRILLFLFNLVICTDTISQEFIFNDSIELIVHNQNYFEEDTIYTVAISGLNLRSAPNASSEVLKRLKFNEPIIFKGSTFNYDEYENRNGVWIEIKDLKGEEGFIFSGYTSKLKFPENIDIRCHSIRDFHKLIDVNEESLLSISKISFKGALRDEKETKSVKINAHKNGTSLNLKIGYEWTEALLETYFLTQNDVLNYLDYYLIVSKQECSEANYYESPKIVVEKDKLNLIVKRIYVEPEHIYSFESITIGDKLLVRYYVE